MNEIYRMHPGLSLLLLGAALVISLVAFGYVIENIYDGQYTKENHITLEKTIEIYQNATPVDNIFSDVSSGYFTVSINSPGMAELYIVRESKPGCALRAVYRGADGRMMNNHESLRYPEDVDVYTFICTPDGKMSKSVKHIPNEMVQQSQEKSSTNIVDYCKATGGC
jgi:hypothetical protein